jgi:hypothetical protein
VERLSALLGHHVQFSYTALDRIVLNGYLSLLQRPENLVYFFHKVAGISCIEPSVLGRRTEAYRTWVQEYLGKQRLQLIPAPKEVRKEEFVQPHYQRLDREEGVACVLSSMEQDRTFVSYTPRFPTSDPSYRIIAACRKQFLHYYFYVLDPVMGPMSLRFATYLPFNVTCYLNGHSFLAQELTRQGIKFQKEDNAITAAADPAGVQAAANRLTPALLKQRCQHWIEQLGPRFPAQEQAALDLTYRFSAGQLELATDVLFKRSAPLKSLFRRAVELGVLLGGADHTTHLFGRRITRRYQGKLQTVLDRRNDGQPVLRSYYQSSFVKQYEKGDRLLRTETCINDPRHLGIGRSIDNLPSLMERMAGTNDRYLDLQAELLDSTVDTGQLAQLTAPTLLGRRRIPRIKLHDDRVIRLMDVLLHPGGFVADWTTRDVHARLLERHRLTDAGYRLTQLRYDLTKLRAKGVVQRIGTSRRYTVTALGVRLGVLLPSKAHAARSPKHLSAVETALRQVDASLDNLCAQLGLQVA